MALTPEEAAEFQLRLRPERQRPTSEQEEFNTLMGKPTVVPPGPRQAQDIGDALIAGMQSSVTGLAWRMRNPDLTLPDDAPWYQRIAAGASGIVGDLPAIVPGVLAGGALTRNNPFGLAIGGFSAPMAVREGLMTAYGHNNALSWQGAVDIATATGKGALKGATIGVATVAGGMGATGLLAKAAPGASALVQGTTKFAGELTGLTTMASALEGHMPTWRDFMDNAILLGGFKGGTAIAARLRSVYAQTGKHPAEVALDAKADRGIADWLESGDLLGEVPPLYRTLAFNERVRAALDNEKGLDIMAATVAEAVGKAKTDLKGDMVRYEYITDEVTAEAVIRAVAEASKESVEQHRRGIIPTAESIAKAVALIESGELKPHVRGQADAPEVASARAMLTKDAAIRAATMFKALADTPVEQRTPQQRLAAHAAMEQVALFYKGLTGGVAEAARTLRMMGEIKRNPALLGEARLMLEVYEKSGKSVDRLAGMMESIKDPAALAEFISQANKATTLEKLIYVWRAGILSGIHTTGANVLGNVGKVAWDAAFDAPISATLTAAQRAVRGDPLTWAQFKARAFAPWIGWQLAWRDAFTTAKEVWQQKGENFEKYDTFRKPIDSELAGLPYRWLQTQDAFFRTPAERAKAYEIAVDRAVKDGIDPSTAEGMNQIMQWTNKPQLGLNERAAQKVTEALEVAGSEAVFAQRLGPKMELVQRALTGSPAQFIVPFMRTPLNLLSWAMSHVPGLNFLSPRWWQEFNAGGELRNRAIARVASGAAMGLAFMAAEENGLVTGGGMFNPEQRKTKEGVKWQPYSFYFNGQYYSYQRMEPIGKIIGLAADMSELLNTKLPPDEKAKVAYMLVAMLGNATVSTTYLSGLANTMETLTDPNQKAESFVESYAGSLVPKIIGQTTAMFDPYDREVNGVVEALMKQLPILRSKLLPKIDVWGEPVERGTLFKVLPIATSVASQDKVKQEAKRLEFAIADAPKFVEEKGPFRPKDKRLELTPEERNVFKVVTGKQAMAILAPLVNSPEWDSLPDYAQRDAYRDAFEFARKQGREAAVPADSAARDAVRQRIIDRINTEAAAAKERSQPQRKRFE